MDELSISQVNADVVNDPLAQGDEKHEIARSQFVERDRIPAPELVFARAMKGDLRHCTIHDESQSRTIDAGPIHSTLAVLYPQPAICLCFPLGRADCFLRLNGSSSHGRWRRRAGVMSTLATGEEEGGSH